MPPSLHLWVFAGQGTLSPTLRVLLRLPATTGEPTPGTGGGGWGCSPTPDCTAVPPATSPPPRATST